MKSHSAAENVACGNELIRLLVLDVKLDENVAFGGPPYLFGYV